MVEFVLISPLIFLLVGGIIQFGLAINYWMDMQRIANQGARWAAVARYPLPDGTSCPSASSTCATMSLQDSLAAQAEAQTLDPRVSICFPNSTNGVGTVGEPVQVRLETGFSFVPILGIGTVTLGADAEMRIEQPPLDVYRESANCGS
jgi:Flp pilus assembly protein TadG